MESIRVRASRRRTVERCPQCPQLQLIFRLSSSLGLSPLVFEKGKSRFSCILALHSILILCITTCTGIVNVFSNIMFFNNISLATITLINVQINIALQISSVIAAYFNASEYGRIFELLEEIDTKLSTIGVLKVHRLHWSTKPLEILMVSVHFVVAIAIRTEFSALFYLLGFASYILICSQIFEIGSHIISRYDLVLQTLGQLKDPSRNTNDTVETLLIINNQLTRVVNVFSSCYRLQLLVLTTFTFFMISSRLYFIYFFFKMYNILRVLYFTSFVCFYFFRIARCSSIIMNKVKHSFSNLLFRFMS